MSNKRRLQRLDDEDESHRRDKRRRRRKHLYVALDDLHKDFSIHKIRLSDDDDQLPMIRLSDPPVLQLESPAGGDMSFSALAGTSKIFAFTTNQRSALVYDTDMARLSVGPHPPAEMASCYSSTYIPAGNLLYALSCHPLEKKHRFFAMSWGPTAPDPLHKPTEGWSWKTLPPPPFTTSRVAAYALHPDGRTIFMTTAEHQHTFSFDIKDSAWTCVGDWPLPFHHQGHFDSELDAWIGLRFDGAICACPVVNVVD